MRAEYTSSSMNHVEGGWPKDVNTADEEQTKRYRRKIEKDEGFNHTMMQLFKVIKLNSPCETIALIQTILEHG